MSHDLPPAGFSPHDRRSPLTAPWEPIYRNAQGPWVVLGVEIRAAHTNSRGLVHGGLVAALLDYLGLAKLGQWLTFEPYFVETGRTLCVAEASALADGVIIARGRSTFRTGGAEPRSKP